MIELKNIKKEYKKVTALDNIYLNFRDKELVCVIGASGSGKSTLLNIIGGLDNYTSGDLVINGKSTKSFSALDWDSYRNNYIGFIFQNYNLINYLNVYQNIELALSIKNSKIKKTKIISALKKLNIENLLNKKSNELSGGQMQRVAIARALVKNPCVILADEPTGSLDSKTAKEVMKTIKEISNDRLVIMVTHNENFAKKYASRIIKIKDGRVIKDTNPLYNIRFNKEFIKKKTNLNIIEAFKLSIKNIIKNKKRTIITSISSSIGLISLLLVLCISTSFSKMIEKYDKLTSSSVPIIIPKELKINNNKINSNEIYSVNKNVHVNNINDDFLHYISDINNKYGTIIYDKVSILNHESYLLLKRVPNNSYIKNNYKLLYGNYPKRSNELGLVVNDDNSVNDTIVKYVFNNKDKISFDNVIDKEITISSTNYKISGILKNNINYEDDNSGIIYSNNYIDKNNSSSEILSISIYPNNYKYKKLIIGYLNNYNKNKENKITYKDYGKENVAQASKFIKLITIILIFFSCISLFVSSIMIGIITYISVLERTREIGILRSLGLRKKDVIFLFNSQSIILGLLSSIIAISINYVLIYMINKILYKYININNFVHMYFKNILIIILIGLLVNLIGSILPSISAGNKNPISAIKGE